VYESTFVSPRGGFCPGNFPPHNCFSKVFEKNCFNFVQTVSSAVFPLGYAPSMRLFHIVFNTTVENFVPAIVQRCFDHLHAR
jgi:hypothetical protein